MAEKLIDRFHEYLEYKGIPPTRFEKDTGLSNGYLGTMKKRNSDVGEQIIRIIIDNCLDINAIWLLTGEGKMIREDKLGNLIANADKNVPKSVLNASEKNVTPTVTPTVYPTVYPTTKNDDIYAGRQNIILVEQRVAAGWAQIIQDEAQIQSLPRFTVPQLMHKMGTFYCFPVAGDSMHPTVKDKEWVIVQQKEAISDIKGGRVYMFCTPEGLCLKRLYYKSGEKTVKCVSDNETHSPYKENVEDILSIYEAIIHFSDDFRNVNNELRVALNAAVERISRIENHVFDRK